MFNYLLRPLFRRNNLNGPRFFHRIEEIRPDTALEIPLPGGTWNDPYSKKNLLVDVIVGGVTWSFTIAYIYGLWSGYITIADKPKHRRYVWNRDYDID